MGNAVALKAEFRNVSFYIRMENGTFWVDAPPRTDAHLFHMDIVDTKYSTPLRIGAVIDNKTCKACQLVQDRYEMCIQQKANCSFTCSGKTSPCTICPGCLQLQRKMRGYA